MSAAAHRSSAGPLAAAFAALVVYATLYPFTGWRWPPGLDVASLLTLPWPPFRNRFDIVANVAGYLPLGLLVYGACVRNGLGAARGFATAAIGAAALSYVLEVVQTLLPVRVPSRLDWVLNFAGACLGAALGALLHWLGWLDRWQVVRDRWFARRSAGALALVLEGTPWADAAAEWALQPVHKAALSPPSELVAIALGLLAPCLVAFTAARPGWRRVLLAVGAGALGFVAMTLSTALNFAPEHALAWLTPVTLPALGLGVLLAALCAPIGRRTAAGLGLVVLTALIALVAQAPSDPYYADSLQAWEQGRFIRFHGVARWVGWLWPYLAMVWLLLNIGGRHRGEP
jgi:VanZ family protein